MQKENTYTGAKYWYEAERKYKSGIQSRKQILKTTQVPNTGSKQKGNTYAGGIQSRKQILKARQVLNTSSTQKGNISQAANTIWRKY